VSTYTHETYLSPFTWRYGSSEMRHIWSEAYKRRLWRRIWVALADAQRAAGLVRTEQVDDLRAHEDTVDLERAAAIEAQIQHDLMAEVRCFAEQCTIGGSIIHWGATSADVEDNADALRIREALDLVLERLRRLLFSVAEQVDRHADHVCMGFTHLQPAEPTTVGYRLALYGQDLLADWLDLGRLRREVRGKGFRGAVGTAASYQELLSGTTTSPQQLENHAMGLLGLEGFAITGQTYPRRQDWLVVSALAGMGSVLYRMAFDLRVLQSPLWGEWAEPFASAQVGSSAMPFKRNPVHSENVNSLARFLGALPRVAWDNAAHSLLERTLDDSANRRTILPEAFLAADELLMRMGKIVGGLRVDDRAVKRNLRTY
jgi:adenylosuccinate lyase